MSAKHHLQNDTTSETPSKRAKTMPVTPGIYKPLLPITPRTPNSVSAYTQFPAAEFSSWIDGIKAKATAALQENEALDVQFRQSRELEEEIENRKRQERDRFTRLIAEEAQREEEELRLAAEDAEARALQRQQGTLLETADEEQQESEQSDDESVEGQGDCPRSSENSSEDEESQSQTQSEASAEYEEGSELEAAALSELSAHTSQQDFDHDDNASGHESMKSDKGRTSRQSTGRIFASPTVEETDDLFGDHECSDNDGSSDKPNVKDDEFDEHGSDFETYESEEHGLRDDSSEPVELISSEDEQDNRSHGQTISDVEHTQSLGTVLQSFEANSPSDAELDFDIERSSDIEDADSQKAPEGSTTQELGEEFGDSDVDGDPHAPEAFAQATEDADNIVYDEQAGRDWLTTSHVNEAAQDQGSNEIATYDEDSETHSNKWSKAEEDITGTSLSLQPDQIPEVQSTIEEHRSDVLTENEMEDERYHMWQDDMVKTEGLDPIVEQPDDESASRKHEENTEPLTRNFDNRTESLIQNPDTSTETTTREPVSPTAVKTHTHPLAHFGHEHDHRGHTTEEYTLETAEEAAFSPTEQDIEDGTRQNFDVMRDAEGTLLAIGSKDESELGPMSEAEEHALVDEVEYLEHLENDELQDFPTDLSLEAGSESTGVPVESIESDGNLADFIDGSSAGSGKDDSSVAEDIHSEFVVMANDLESASQVNDDASEDLPENLDSDAASLDIGNPAESIEEVGNLHDHFQVSSAEQESQDGSSVIENDSEISEDDGHIDYDEKTLSEEPSS